MSSNHFAITDDPKPTTPAHIRWPFAHMGVDQCAVFDADADFTKINRAAHQIGMNHKKKFTVRRCNDNKIRVWRIA